MARRKSKGAVISLFPFLSILVCVIGCLTMIIVFINLIQMNQAEGKEPEEVEFAKEYVEVDKKKKEDQVKLDRLRQLIENLIQDQDDMRSKREKLRRLPDEVIEATVRQFATSNTDSAPLHFDSLKRILDRDEPDYKN